MAIRTPHKRANCYRCRHYFVTWDRHAPHGCRRLGFKGQSLPSETVYKSSGLDCLQFEPKSRSPSGKR